MIVATAREFIGTPYRHQGRSGFAVDCIGLVIVVLDRHALIPAEVRRANYGRLPRAELIEKCRHYCTRLELPEPGCMVLIRWPGENFPGHAALFTGQNLLHAYGQMGRVVEHGYRGAWLKRTDSLWRLPGVTTGG